MIDALAEWFTVRGWSPFPFQREVWNAYLAGESGLVHAATGTGKTLAAWLGPIAEWMAEGRPVSARPRRQSYVPLRVLWITPLRALAADTAAALQAPLASLAPEWSIETRTGDTSSAARARQSRRLPTALLTTPESLTILLSRPESLELMRDLRLIVVDEWHELMGTKRGVQTELALARLRAIRPALRTWGLSATLGNLGEALDTLLGTGVTTRSRIVKGETPKQITVDALLPAVIERFPWAGHLGRGMVEPVAAALEQAESSIVFTNTRRQTEEWYRSLLDSRPDWAGLIALHHGSLDRSTREWVEQALRDGRLKCVVATSSLDLGVDFSPVDRVVQVGSSKSVGRLVQRAGRSGHRPGAESRITCAPTNVLELIDLAAARDAVEADEVESRRPVERPLDVLVQHLVTVAMGTGFRAEDLLAEVRRTRAFAKLTDEEWQWAMEFVASGGGALGAYPEYARVVRQEDGHYRVESDTIAKRHRLSIGTIVSDGQIAVTYQRGKPIGMVDEVFISRLKPGDRFTLAGKTLEFIRVREMQAWVRRASPSQVTVTSPWSGTRLPISGALAARIRARLDEASRGVFRGAEMDALKPVLAVQERWSRIPAADEVLIERVATREGHHLYVYPFEGRLVHEGLAALVAYRLSRLKPISFSIATNDYGFSLLSAEPAPVEPNVMFSVDDLADDLLAALNATEMARRQFREIARVAGLIFPGLPRSGKTARQLQASSNLFFDVFQKHDPGNLLVAQAYREVMERQLESARLARTLERLSRARVVITDPPRTTPFGFPLLVDRTRDRVSSETLADRVRRMQLALERAAG
jgi:ATP-dependent helicase Lhr and Lhr-like helicase